MKRHNMMAFDVPFAALTVVRLEVEPAYFAGKRRVGFTMLLDLLGSKTAISFTGEVTPLKQPPLRCFLVV